MSTEGDVSVERGIVEGVAPSATVLHPYTLTLVATRIVYAAAALYLLSPPTEDAAGITAHVPETDLSVGGDDADGRRRRGDRADGPGRHRRARFRLPGAPAVTSPATRGAPFFAP